MEQVCLTCRHHCRGRGNREGHVADVGRETVKPAANGNVTKQEMDVEVVKCEIGTEMARSDAFGAHVSPLNVITPISNGWSTAARDWYTPPLTPEPVALVRRRRQISSVTECVHTSFDGSCLSCAVAFMASHNKRIIRLLSSTLMHHIAALIRAWDAVMDTVSHRSAPNSPMPFDLYGTNVTPTRTRQLSGLTELDESQVAMREELHQLATALQTIVDDKNGSILSTLGGYFMVKSEVKEAFDVLQALQQCLLKDKENLEQTLDLGEDRLLHSYYVGCKCLKDWCSAASSGLEAQLELYEKLGCVWNRFDRKLCKINSCVSSFKCTLTGTTKGSKPMNIPETEQATDSESESETWDLSKCKERLKPLRELANEVISLNGSKSCIEACNDLEKTITGLQFRVNKGEFVHLPDHHSPAQQCGQESGYHQSDIQVGIHNSSGDNDSKIGATEPSENHGQLPGINNSNASCDNGQQTYDGGEVNHGSSKDRSTSVSQSYESSSQGHVIKIPDPASAQEDYPILNNDFVQRNGMDSGSTGITSSMPSSGPDESHRNVDLDISPADKTGPDRADESPVLPYMDVVSYKDCEASVSYKAPPKPKVAGRVHKSGQQKGRNAKARADGSVLSHLPVAASRRKRNPRADTIASTNTSIKELATSDGNTIHGSNEQRGNLNPSKEITSATPETQPSGLISRVSGKVTSGGYDLFPAATVSLNGGVLNCDILNGERQHSQDITRSANCARSHAQNGKSHSLNTCTATSESNYGTLKLADPESGIDRETTLDRNVTTDSSEAFVDCLDHNESPSAATKSIIAHIETDWPTSSFKDTVGHDAALMTEHNYNCEGMWDTEKTMGIVTERQSNGGSRQQGLLDDVVAQGTFGNSTSYRSATTFGEASGNACEFYGGGSSNVLTANGKGIREAGESLNVDASVPILNTRSDKGTHLSLDQGIVAMNSNTQFNGATNAAAALEPPQGNRSEHLHGSVDFIIVVAEESGSPSDGAQMEVKEGKPIVGNGHVPAEDTGYYVDSVEDSDAVRDIPLKRSPQQDDQDRASIISYTSLNKLNSRITADSIDLDIGEQVQHQDSRNGHHNSLPPEAQKWRAHKAPNGSVSGDTLIQSRKKTASAVTPLISRSIEKNAVPASRRTSNGSVFKRTSLISFPIQVIFLLLLCLALFLAIPRCCEDNWDFEWRWRINYINGPPPV